MEEEQNIDEAQLDVLDMLMRPPLPGTMQEAMAYWEYLDCQKWVDQCRKVSRCLRMGMFF